MSKFAYGEYVFVKTKPELEALMPLLPSAERLWWKTSDRYQKAGRRIKVYSNWYNQNIDKNMVAASGLTWLEDMLLTRDEYFDRKPRSKKSEKPDPIPDDVIRKLLTD